MNVQKSLACNTCAQLVINALDKKIVKNVKKQKFALTGIKNTALNEKEDFIPIDFVMVEPNLMLSLSKRARDIVCKIMSDLKLGNVLWYFDRTKNTRDSTALKELRDKKIIYPTENRSIHIVNPFYIRRGNFQDVLVNSTNLLFKSSCVSQELIKNLKTGQDVDLDVTQLLSSTSIPA